MKPTSIIHPIVLFAATFAISAGAAPEQPAVTLPTGEPVTVLAAEGTTTEYVKSIKVVTEQALVFSGTQVVQKADGSCVKVETELLEVQTLRTAGGTVQQPRLRTKTNPVKCPT